MSPADRAGRARRARPGARAKGPAPLTHLAPDGSARMVDIGEKPVTRRTATAVARVAMSAPVLAAALAGDGPKGEVLGTARIAAIQAAKRTSELVPLCHPIRLDEITVGFEPDRARGVLVVHTRACATDRTGVEMEALVAATTAALVIYDMTKALDKATSIESVQLVEKTGGKSGDWRRPAS